jgi:hypothetical protein
VFGHLTWLRCTRLVDVAQGKIVDGIRIHLPSTRIAGHVA